MTLFRAGVFQDQGEMFDLPQGQSILQGHHHILASEEERSSWEGRLQCSEMSPLFQEGPAWCGSPGTGAQQFSTTTPFHLGWIICIVPFPTEESLLRTRLMVTWLLWQSPTLTVVRPSKVKDLICPFSRKTFSTFGIRRRASFFSMSLGNRREPVHPRSRAGQREEGGEEQKRGGGRGDCISHTWVLRINHHGGTDCGRRPRRTGQMCTPATPNSRGALSWASRPEGGWRPTVGRGSKQGGDCEHAWSRSLSGAAAGVCREMSAAS